MRQSDQALQTQPEVYIAGDSAFVVEFNAVIEPVINQQVLALEARIIELNMQGILDLVPTYCSLLIQFDPLLVSETSMRQLIQRALETLGESSAKASTNSWRVPTCYDAEFGWDIGFASEQTGLSESELITLHSSVNYRVYMIGFAPGYAYLGELPDRLRLARRVEPRPQVPAGSVAIAGQQSSVFSNAAPSGWHVLGRTPLRLFDPERASPCLFSPGDDIKYEAISKSEFKTLHKHVAADVGFSQTFMSEQKP